MRADRLLSLLMLLQTRGQMTAAELAAELEVSERTIYRDVVALNTAGAPVFTSSGPGGGVALLDSYRTTLTGLTRQEAQALFMLNPPAALESLGVGDALRTALLKLAAALPAGRQGEDGQARRRIHLDSAPWGQAEAPAPLLPVLQQAVWEDRCLEIVYRASFDARIRVLAAPYGLVAKVNVWYLVYDRGEDVRALKVARILEAVPLKETFTRPADFDLAAFWKKWCAANEANRPRLEVRARFAPQVAPYLPAYFGDDIRQQLAQAAPPDEHGWITLALVFDDFETARRRMLSLGRAAEVLEPLSLRMSVADYARQAAEMYGAVIS